ncbi:MAG TPA: hypothetical protein VEZ11_12750 [Thermoanaerobaculia bacterium]|nr:hypothetical protein [Thermoanaerobaculia bacterium]
MKRLAALALAAMIAMPAVAGDQAKAMSGEELSRRATALAAELYEQEKKIAAKLRKAAEQHSPDAAGGEAVESMLYDDVLNLLDAALLADKDNFHAHALAAEVLFRKSNQGEGVYEICSLLDAEEQIDYVLANAETAEKLDLESVKRIKKAIDAIPEDRIAGDEGDCEEKDGKEKGTAWRQERRGTP